MPLLISRHAGETITIDGPGGRITIHVKNVGDKLVRLVFIAPSVYTITRPEWPENHSDHPAAQRSGT